MPRQPDILPLACERAAPFAIGRIANTGAEGAISQRPRRQAHIHAVHADARVQAIQRHGTPRAVRRRGVQLNRIEHSIRTGIRHQHRQNAAACSQIRYAFHAPVYGKIRQQHGIRAEAEAFFQLYQSKAVAHQIVDALAPPQSFQTATPYCKGRMPQENVLPYSPSSIGEITTSPAEAEAWINCPSPR